jgi:hypothetical protein
MVAGQGIVLLSDLTPPPGRAHRFSSHALIEAKLAASGWWLAAGETDSGVIS